MVYLLEDTFTAPQAARGKLLSRQWQELQEIVEWIAPTKEKALKNPSHYSHII